MCGAVTRAWRLTARYVVVEAWHSFLARPTRLAPPSIGRAAPSSVPAARGACVLPSSRLRYVAWLAASNSAAYPLRRCVLACTLNSRRQKNDLKEFFPS